MELWWRDDFCRMDSDQRVGEAQLLLEPQPSSSDSSTWMSALSNCALCSSTRKPGVFQDDQPQLLALTGAFERRGLRRWDILWNSSFGELNGTVLTVYDVDGMENEQTLLVHVLLSESFEVRRFSETDFQLYDRDTGSAAKDLPFQWRCSDRRVADRWLQCLEQACSPARLSRGVTSVIPEEELGNMPALDSELVMTMLTPSMLGGSLLFDLSALEIISQCWMQVMDVTFGMEGYADVTPQPATSRSLHSVAERFQACLLGDVDLDVALLILALDEWARLLAPLGTWAIMLGKEAYKNSENLAAGRDVGIGESVQERVENEVQQGAHQPGAIVDPSAAIAVLWCCRGLTLWVSLSRGCAQAGKSGVAPENLFKRCVDDAYERTLKPFHGPVMQTVYDLGTRWLPCWSDVWPKLALTQQSFNEDNEKMSQAIESVTARLAHILVEHDLYDTRKTM